MSKLTKAIVIWIGILLGVALIGAFLYITHPSLIALQIGALAGHLLGYTIIGVPILVAVKKIWGWTQKRKQKKRNNMIRKILCTVVLMKRDEEME